uniref:Histone H2A n=1 Tax=Timema bartmani TaxID=61472 RepID=A0A7R9ET39_9NEOP|nr:unnamed protein product [Timema bartmani]
MPPPKQLNCGPARVVDGEQDHVTCPVAPHTACPESTSTRWYNESGYQSHRGRSSFPPLAESIVCSGRIASRSEFDTGGHVYLATVVGYLVAEVLEMTRNAALAARKPASSNFINNWLFAMTRNSINFSQA